MNRKILRPILALLVMGVLAACGGSQPAEPVITNEEIVVDMEDIYFGDSNDNIANPPAWTVTSGADITVRMENMGALEHSWVVLKAGEDIPANFDPSQHSDLVLFDSGVVDPDSNATTRFTAPPPGEYNVVCTVLGHSGLMQGRLLVTQ
jgi:plastocyanin